MALKRSLLYCKAGRKVFCGDAFFMGGGQFFLGKHSEQGAFRHSLQQSCHIADNYSVDPDSTNHGSLFPFKNYSMPPSLSVRNLD